MPQPKFTLVKTNGTVENLECSTQLVDIYRILGTEQIDTSGRFKLGPNRIQSEIYFRDDVYYADPTLPLNTTINAWMLDAVTTTNYNKEYLAQWGGFGFRGDIIVRSIRAVM